MPQASACCGKAVLWGIPRGYSPNQDVRLGCTGCLHPQSGLLQTLRPRAGTFWSPAGIRPGWAQCGLVRGWDTSLPLTLWVSSSMGQGHFPYSQAA